MFTNLLQVLGLAWWVEIKTDSPRCTYYFGPFSSSKEADAAKDGYVEDLEKENAQGIHVALKRGKFDTLTIDHEMTEQQSQGNRTPAFSGQA